eukprot:3774284-Prymnesium_polylepis.1
MSSKHPSWGCHHAGFPQGRRAGGHASQRRRAHSCLSASACAFSASARAASTCRSVAWDSPRRASAAVRSECAVAVSAREWASRASRSPQRSASCLCMDA